MEAAERGDCPSCWQIGVLGKLSDESEFHCFACWDEFDGCWQHAKPVKKPSLWAVLPLPKELSLLSSQDVRVSHQETKCMMTMVTDPHGYHFTGHGATFWSASLLLAQTLSREPILPGTTV